MIRQETDEVEIMTLSHRSWITPTLTILSSSLLHYPVVGCLTSIGLPEMSLVRKSFLVQSSNFVDDLINA